METCIKMKTFYAKDFWGLDKVLRRATDYRVNCSDWVKFKTVQIKWVRAGKDKGFSRKVFFGRGNRKTKTEK